jgi:UrcA family protein
MHLELFALCAQRLRASCPTAAQGSRLESKQEIVMSPITRNLMGAVAALVLTAWQGAALGTSLAGIPTETHSVTVKYADLNLDHAADIGVLYHRIRLAAGIACGESHLTGSHISLPAWEQCVRLAVDDAVAKLDRPALSAYHRESTGESARKG